jgi:uncharacterized protein HemY
VARRSLLEPVLEGFLSTEKTTATENKMRKILKKSFSGFRKSFTVLVLLSVFWLSAHPLHGEVKKTLIIPFKVIPAGETAHQWLGRAVSFYLISGLQANQQPVVPDYQGTSLLEANHIMFPYHITKATAMHLAEQYRIDWLVWGEILLENHDAEPANNSSIQVRAFVIDLRENSQKYLPLVKGHINDLFKIEEELLTSLVRVLLTEETTASSEAPESQGNTTVDLHYPQFHLDHRSYEIYIKSLLVKEIKKKIPLLEKAQKVLAGKTSGFLNLELAKLYAGSGRWEDAAAQLEKIQSQNQDVPSWLDREKHFLEGLIAVAKKDIDNAIKAFTTLLPDLQFSFTANHNLGVIYFKRKDYESAQRYFQQALTERKDPETWWSLIQVLLARGDNRQAALQLNRALRLYPEEEKLVKLFADFLAQAENRESLFNLFQNYIPGLFLSDGEAQDLVPSTLLLKLRNPFKLQLQKPFTDSAEANEILNGAGEEEIDNSLERLQGLLEMNPFEPGYYRSISQLYLKKKKFRQAELHGLALIFLEKTSTNYLLMAKIYKAMKNKKKAKEMKKTSALFLDSVVNEPF